MIRRGTPSHSVPLNHQRKRRVGEGGKDQHNNQMDEGKPQELNNPLKVIKNHYWGEDAATIKTIREADADGQGKGVRVG